MEELKQKIEALLFSSGRKMPVEEIAMLCNKSIEKVQEALESLKKDYDDKDTSLMVVEEGNAWKLTVREQHLQMVRNIVTKTELSKSLMETLAVIAFKYPILQSDLIKLRTNKAYDHLRELEEMGYISRQKHGRSNLIKLTQKFFDYFSLAEEKLKEHFGDFESIAKAIAEKETEAKNARKAIKQRAEEEKEEEKRAEEEIDLLDEEDHPQKLEVYEDKKARKKPEVKPYGEKLGALDVIDELEEEAEPEPEEEPEVSEPEEGGVEESSDVDKKVEELLHAADDAEGKGYGSKKESEEKEDEGSEGEEKKEESEDAEEEPEKEEPEDSEKTDSEDDTEIQEKSTKNKKSGK